jgi:tetratricopeptide (TPR) repeat protein
VAWVVGRYPGRVTAATVALGASALAIVTMRQVVVWHDSTALLTHALRVNPASWVAHQNLGGLLSDQGRLDAALAEYASAARLRPDDAEIVYNTGTVLLRLGRPEDAAARFAETLRLDPTFVAAHYNLGTILLREGRLDDAVAHYAEATRLAPDFAQAREALDAVRALRDRTRP